MGRNDVTIMVTSGFFMYVVSLVSISALSSAMVRPDARNWPTSGIEMMPSGPMGAVVDSWASPNTVMLSTSPAPSMYPVEAAAGSVALAAGGLAKARNSRAIHIIKEVLARDAMRFTVETPLRRHRRIRRLRRLSGSNSSRTCRSGGTCRNRICSRRRSGSA